MSDPTDGAVFIRRFDSTNDEAGTLRVAVKDAIDVAGVVTTNGCKAIADYAMEATRDAACLSHVRHRARIVGKANMHELGFGVTGINPWFGTPTNPLAPELIPGGSSSGAAVAVARGLVDVGIGTDTGGSVRFPAGCCGIFGLKSTWGRIPLQGVAPLAPSMDSVGTLARDVATLCTAMSLIEPGFQIARGRSFTVGRFRLDADSSINEAVDRALSSADLKVVSLEPSIWEVADAFARLQLLAEVHETLGWLARERPWGIAPDTLRRFHNAATITKDDRKRAEQARALWRAQLEQLFARFDALVLPTMVEPPPSLLNAGRASLILRTRAANFAGVPALAIPISLNRCSGRQEPVPPSLQLVGAWNTEEQLLAIGHQIESGVLELRARK